MRALAGDGLKDRMTGPKGPGLWQLQAVLTGGHATAIRSMDGKPADSRVEPEQAGGRILQND